ncbi:MAG TPA: hypothetical protein VF062_11365 [Candidatus Limnocylindrales bacterium]
MRPGTLKIVGVELTQATQYFPLNGNGAGAGPDNSVPLVNLRQTMVRVYAAVKTPPLPPRPGRPPNIDIPLGGRLHYLPTGAPESRRKTVKALLRGRRKRDSDLDRADLRDSLNFVIPAQDCQGTLRLQIDIFEDPPVFTPTASSVTEPVRRTATVYARFTNVPAFRVYPVLVHYIGRGLDIAAPTPADFARFFQFTLNTYPIGRLQSGDCATYDFDGDLTLPGPGCGAGYEDLLRRLERMKSGGDRTGVYVALLPPGTPSHDNIQGCGDYRGVIVAMGPVPSGIMAHEIGHNLGRKHAPCGNAQDIDPSYPQYDSYHAASVGETGVLISPLRAFDPDYTDFMGYCFQQQWVSPYTYTAILAKMQERWGSAILAAAVQREEELLDVRFELRGDKVTMVDTMRRKGLLEEVPGRDTAITVELVGDGGEVLAGQRCLVRNPYQRPEDEWLAFSETLVWVPGTTGLVVKRGNEILHRLEVPRTAMALAASEPVFDAETGTLSWGTAALADAGQEEASHQVEFSNDDGATWRVIAHTAGNGCRVDVRSLPGGERCKLRVVTSAGFQTGHAETAPFPVEVKPRRAIILEPQRHRHFPQGEPAGLLGGGFGAGQGLSDPAETRWESDVDGELGSGHSLVVVLSPGKHVLTVSVPDGLGGTSRHRTTVTVGDGLFVRSP